jgi:DNA-binding CsgD family transcriptional regulator
MLHENPALVREAAFHEDPELRDAIRRVTLAVAASSRPAQPGDSSPAPLRVPTARWMVIGSRVSDADGGDAEPAILVALQPRVDDSLPTELLHDRFGLTPRELEVLRLLHARQSNQEIAGRLGISAHTARHHTEHVLLKIGLTSRRDVETWWSRVAVEMGDVGATRGR